DYYCQSGDSSANHYIF
nr:immunoglobulin light chain junction region [Macaca mulatta]MOV73274.1 immunoglobulin light chain junction region [Macaca mulatta]MOV73524.1 immunoglobulin light chain junction region [Macaca mulatta]MOV73619.1 immunoglobulin light chain junction region [Macaca mulatta]MOV73756.1 immunoglobulin light chain junction region [Macaca mulatta]